MTNNNYDHVNDKLMIMMITSMIPRSRVAWEVETVPEAADESSVADGRPQRRRLFVLRPTKNTTLLAE